MKRMKRHKIKQEMPETSKPRFRDQEEHDLAYYIHDRVELMHQVFSVVKLKELKAMAPQCVQHISIDDLQELCTEELLGISSKRLCAILDGAEPPTDTESSSSEHLETISLDSISSDEEILSQPSTKKKHRHKKHRSKNKHKRKNSKDSDQENREDEDRSKASRAGLTVLELLELQARARAIRAQLQQDNANAHIETEQNKPHDKHDSSDEVEIKEEPAEVVEISSEDEKPKIEDLPVKLPSANKGDVSLENSKRVTKKINDLIITVPQSKQNRKIKLNRNKPVALTNTVASSKENPDSAVIPTETVTTLECTNSLEGNNEKNKPKAKDNKTKAKKKQKKKDKKVDKDCSDHDEITLQLSDTEKMDLLEDFDRKNYENFTSSSEDSESSSNTKSESDTSKDSNAITKYNSKQLPTSEKQIIIERIYEHAITNNNVINDNEEQISNNKGNGRFQKELSTVSNSDLDILNKNENQKSRDNKQKYTERDKYTNANSSQASKSVCENEFVMASTSDDIYIEKKSKETPILIKTSDQGSVKILRECSTKSIEVTGLQNEMQNKTETIKIKNNMTGTENDNLNFIEYNETFNEDKEKKICVGKKLNENISTHTDTDEKCNAREEANKTTCNPEQNKNLSEGEITDGESTEMQTNNVEIEIVCISDDENKNRKKKKKEKKSKKERKSKKSTLDFHDTEDQSSFRESLNYNESLETQEKMENKKEDEKPTKCTLTLEDSNDDIYEILELSDDSSCYEVEGLTVSKEPTAAEIEALSAKIDEINADSTIVVDDNTEQEVIQRNVETDNDIENISWRDRYLGSKKVKRVLKTSNILNALRKKNKELKRKIDECKKKTIDTYVEETKKQEIPKDKNVIEEGSIEHFNTLEGSTKYVNPVLPEDISKDSNAENPGAVKTVTKEMEKDAKQLLKMYKRLLKYNDMNKRKDPNRKKKKKHKKNKEKEEQNKNPNNLQVSNT